MYTYSQMTSDPLGCFLSPAASPISCNVPMGFWEAERLHLIPQSIFSCLTKLSQFCDAETCLPGSCGPDSFLDTNQFCTQ